MDRIYNVSDAVVIGHSGRVRENLGVDLPDFTGYDPDLNDAKVQELEEAETAALAIGTHEEFQAKSKMLTKKVNEALERCQKIGEDFRYFSEKHFGDQPAFLGQFGMSKFSKIRKNQYDMVMFFSTFARVVQNNREVLVTKGVKEELLDSIAPAGEHLKKSNDEQEAFMKTEKVVTRKRRETYNYLWNILGQFSKAAALIYKDRSDKRGIYTLPTNTTTTNETEDGLVTE